MFNISQINSSEINSSIFYKLLSILNFSRLKKQITKLSNELKNEQNIFEKNLLNLNEDLAKNEIQKKLLKDLFQHEVPNRQTALS